MTQNYLFPCKFVQVMADHIYLDTVIPKSPGTCLFKCMTMVPETPQTEKATQYWEANYNVVRAMFDEDFQIVEGIQKGFAAGVNDHFVIGRFETSIQFSQKTIEAALASA